MMIYLYWRVRYTLPYHYGWLATIAGVTLVIAEIVGFFESIVLYWTLVTYRKEKRPYWNEETDWATCPDVDVLIATYNESYEILYKTIIGSKFMDYPKEKLHIYVCDDGRREFVRQMAKRLNVHYITRENNEHAKAGNLNHAFGMTKSPFLVTLDADMIPMRDFLKTVIPYTKDETVGFVQLPQNFYNVDPIQHNLFTIDSLPHEQDLFFHLIEPGKSPYNAVIYAGSNTIIRRKALEDIGGFVTGTITEDFATGMLIQSRGYRGVYHDEIHASGLSPETLEDLFNQRIRWGRGVIQTFKKHNPWKLKGLNFMQKILYTTSVSYWYFGVWRFIFMLSPILYGVFGVPVLYSPMKYILVFWVPMYIISNLTFKVLTNGARTTFWSHVYDTITFHKLTWGAILETIGVSLRRFKVTPKDKQHTNDYYDKYHLVSMQLGLFFLSVIGIGHIIFRSIIHGWGVLWTGGMITLFWLFYNAIMLFIAILVSSERPRFRFYERIRVNDVEANIIHKKGTFHGKVYDLSESGVSLTIKEPLVFEPDDLITIHVYNEQYYATLLVRLVHIETKKEGYRYAFLVSGITEKNFQHLIQLMYDRIPERINQVKSMASQVYPVILKYWRMHKKPNPTMNRKYPRIELNKKIEAITGNHQLMFVQLLDFNYVHCMIVAGKPEALLTLQWENKEIVCELDFDYLHRIHRKKHHYLYKIKSYRGF